MYDSFNMASYTYAEAFHIRLLFPVATQTVKPYLTKIYDMNFHTTICISNH